MYKAVPVGHAGYARPVQAAYQPAVIVSARALRRAVIITGTARRVVTGMSELSFTQRVAALYRNDAAFVGDWQDYMGRNRRARRAGPLYGDAVQRLYRAAGPPMFHLTFSIPEDNEPELLCKRPFRKGTKWFGWRDDEERDQVARRPCCPRCHTAYLATVDYPVARARQDGDALSGLSCLPGLPDGDPA